MPLYSDHKKWIDKSIYYSTLLYEDVIERITMSGPRNGFYIHDLILLPEMFLYEGIQRNDNMVVSYLSSQYSGDCTVIVQPMAHYP